MDDLPPKQIEPWKDWISTIKTYLNDLDVARLFEMWESDDFTAMEAVEYLKMEIGL